MTTKTLTYFGTLTATSCWCGIGLAIPSDLYKEANRTKTTVIYCPLGHQFEYAGEPDAAKYERLWKQERDRVAAVRAERDGIEPAAVAARQAFYDTLPIHADDEQYALADRLYEGVLADPAKRAALLAVLLPPSADFGENWTEAVKRRTAIADDRAWQDGYAMGRARERLNAARLTEPDRSETP